VSATFKPKTLIRVVQRVKCTFLTP